MGGYQDLKDRKIRTVGDPRSRFEEDYLRVLRAFRFLLRYPNTEIGDELEDALRDDDVISSIINNPDPSRNVSSERIHDEFRKMHKSAHDRGRLVEMIFDYGLVDKVLFPNIDCHSREKAYPSDVFELMVATILHGCDRDAIHKSLNPLS